MIKAGKAKDVFLFVKYISASRTNPGINQGDKVTGKTVYNFHRYNVLCIANRNPLISISSMCGQSPVVNDYGANLQFFRTGFLCSGRQAMVGINDGIIFVIGDE
jgi:hypothetical protein